MKKVFIIGFLIIGIFQVWGQAQIPVTQVIFTGLDDIPEYYVRKLLTFSEGDLHSKDTLEQEITSSEIKLQADVYVYRAMIEYIAKRGGILIRVNIIKNPFKFELNGFDTGGILGYELYPKLDGNMYFHAGYERQSAGLRLKYIKGTMFGVDANLGHMLVNKYDFDSILSKFGLSAKPYVSPINEINVGVLAQVYYYYDYNDKRLLSSMRTGIFARADYKYFEDIYKVGFTADFEYIISILGNDSTGHGFTSEVNIYSSPFPTDRIEINSVLYGGYLFYDTIEMLKNKISENIIGSHEEGSFVWSAEVSVPFYIYDIKGPVIFRLGIEPFFKIGDVARVLEFNYGDLRMVAGGGPAIKVNIPINLQVVPRLGYEISNGDLFFEMAFQYNQPYSGLFGN